MIQDKQFVLQLVNCRSI